MVSLKLSRALVNRVNRTTALFTAGLEKVATSVTTFHGHRLVASVDKAYCACDKLEEQSIILQAVANKVALEAVLAESDADDYALQVSYELEELGLGRLL